MSSQVVGFTFNFVSENSYLIVDSSLETALVDCGCMNPQEQSLLEEYISQNGLKPKYLLFTHLHFDHTWGMKWAMDRYQLAPMSDPLERTYLPAMVSHLRTMNIDDHPLMQAIPEFGDLQSGETLLLGETPIRILAVPGHAPGHLAFYSPQDGYVLTGDALFREEIGRTDLWGGNFTTLINSLQTQLMTLPDETIVYPGHGEASTIIHEKNNNPYLQ